MEKPPDLSSHPVFTFTISFPYIDWAGRIFYSRIFEIAQSTMERFMVTTPLGEVSSLLRLRQPLPVVVHAEADYLSPIELGDELSIAVSCHRIGNTSFTMGYHMHKQIKKKGDRWDLAARVKVVHVLVKGRGKKVKIPIRWRKVLEGIYSPQ